MRETSLEDFLDGSEDPSSESEAAEPSTSGDPGRDGDSVPEGDGVGTAENGDSGCENPDDRERDAPASAAVESVTVTYAWTPDGADCADCGESVERRWLDSDRLVCADCKQW